MVTKSDSSDRRPKTWNADDLPISVVELRELLSIRGRCTFRGPRFESWVIPRDQPTAVDKAYRLVIWHETGVVRPYATSENRVDWFDELLRDAVSAAYSLVPDGLLHTGPSESGGEAVVANFDQRVRSRA